MKIFKKPVLILLVLITLLAGALRFYKLGKVPLALEWDEVAIGYDAYSILKTGKDQFGKRFPITFRSLDDYKPPVYEYAAVLPIAVFGLNGFSTRFPSAFFGTLSVFLSYFLIKEIFYKKSQNFKNTVGLLTAFFFAISPWHLQFSRAAFEVNLSIFMVLMSVYSFLKALKDHRWFWLTALFSGLGLFSYHSTRVVLPLLMLFLTIVNFKKLPKVKKLIGPTILFSIFLVPFLLIGFSPKTQMRLKVTGIFNMYQNLDTNLELQKNLKVDNLRRSDLRFRFFHGKKVKLFQTFFDNYFSHFDPGFLFSHADMPLHHAPGYGLLHRSEMVLLITGFLAYFHKYLSKKSSIIIAWFLLAPLPAAVTLQVPHAVRTELFLPTWQFFIAIGGFEIFKWLKSNLKTLLIPIIIAWLAWLGHDISSYLHQYYIHTKHEYAKDWLYGRAQAVAYTEAHKDKYDQVVVSTNLEHPHIFWLFYAKYDPKKYLQEGGTKSGSFTEQDNKFDKYHFHLVDRNFWRQSKNTLFVDLYNETPPETEPIETIYYPNGKKAIKIYKSP